MTANTYTYTGPGTRWAAEDPTAEDFLNVARINNDHLHQAVNFIMDSAIPDAGVLKTVSISFTDGDNAITIADGGGCTFPQTITATGDISVGDDILIASGGLINFASDNVILTHSSGVLNVSTGALQVGGTAVLTAAPVTALNNATQSELVTVGSTTTELDAEANLTFDGTTLGVIGNAGVGIARTEGTLHVHTATAGSVTANTSYDDLVIENSTYCGISLLSPNDVLCSIAFGDPENNDDGVIRYDHSTRALEFFTAGAARAYITSGGILGINETINTDMTIGLTINQGTNDDEALALKSTTDVSHALTDFAETDTYAVFKKSVATAGGLHIIGLTDGTATTGNYSLLLDGFTRDDNTDTTKSTSGLAAVVIRAGVHLGSGVTTPGADENLLVVAGYTTTRFIFDAEGSGHSDVEWVAYHKHDDLSVIRDMESELLANEDISQTSRRHYMESIGIIGPDSWHMENGKPRAMVNFTKLSMLHHGALIQIGDRFISNEERIDYQQEQIESLKSELLLLKG